MTKVMTLKSVSLSVGLVALVLASFTFGFAPRASALTPLTSVSSGDLIRGESFSAVYYYGANGMRYVFTTDRSYFTWYTNFDNVKWLSDADVAKIQIGGNVTYRPGVKMIKINTDPKTYAIDLGGTLRHIGSEPIAKALYGDNWSTKVDDVQDGFFSNYTMGTPITDASTFVPATVTASVATINADKSLKAPKLVTISATGYDPEGITVDVGMSVKFVNADSVKHTVTADDLAWGSGTMEPNGSYIKTFTRKGTFSYFDSYDSGNTGTVNVE